MRRAITGITGAALLTTGTLLLGWNGTGYAAGTDAQKCAAAKMTAAGKYAACRLGTDKKAELSGVAADYTKCDDKQLTAWGKIETKYGAQCPTSGDQASVQSNVTAMTTCLAGNFSSTGAPVAMQLSCIPCPLGGVIVNGACWILGAYGDSCTAACALQGMAYDEQTNTFAGTTSGTLGHCAFILDELGAPQPFAAFDYDSGPADIGCSVFARRTVASTTTAQGNNPSYARACACH